MEFQVTTQYFFADGGGLYRESDGGRYVGVVREATEGTKANGAAVEAACGKPISSIARAINFGVTSDS